MYLDEFGNPQMPAIFSYFQASELSEFSHMCIYIYIEIYWVSQITNNNKWIMILDTQYSCYF